MRERPKPMFPERMSTWGPNDYRHAAEWLYKLSRHIEGIDAVDDTEFGRLTEVADCLSAQSAAMQSAIAKRADLQKSTKST